MAILIAYYSRTGVTKKAALELARILDCQCEEVKDIKSRAGVLGYLLSGREAILKKSPAIKNSEHDPAKFDLVIIGTPNWAGAISAPTRTYLSREKSKIKRYAAFITQGGSGADMAKKSLEELMGRPAEAWAVLLAREFAAGLPAEKINSFAEQIRHLSA